MRISISLRSAYPVGDPRSTGRWMVERTVAARDAGLDALFVGDHHAVAGAFYLQNTPVLARLLAEWDDRPAGALFLLPLWHPVLVAEQVGTLAALARGRFIMQCAIGGGREQFDAMGASLRTRAARMDAALGIIRRLLAGEVVTADGPYPVAGAQIGLIPADPVEIWIGGHAPPALDRAARLGDGWIGGPEPLMAQAAALARAYHERCAAHGRTPSTTAIRRDVHVGATSQEADAVARPVLDRGYRGFDPAACVVGSPGQVAEHLAALAGHGFTEVVVRHLADEQQDVLASLERFAEVRAHLRE
jgi:alkanesulfonate monooxygenase SsuD/methylene tetrahydromethanopterin reductase-like flavin-dependent oxidoreductase (luciferase family)